MISDDERREVAARLRVYSHDFDFGDSNPFWYVAKAAFGDVDLHTYYSVFARMADLIDPTCERVLMDSAGRPPFNTGGIALNDVVGGCSECGYPFGNINAIIGNPFNAPNYCPNCGARVVMTSD